MNLYVTLLTVCFSAVAALPAFIKEDDPFTLLSDFVDTINTVGELILDDDQEAMLKKKCEANGGAKAFQEAKNAGFELTQCVQRIVNFTVLQKEIATAKPLGDLDEVFPKYCRRQNEFKICFETFIKSSQGCMKQDELQQRETVDDIINQIVDFACHKGGDRIALLIADKGPQCIEKNLQAINDCVNTTFGSYSAIIPFNPLDEISGLSPGLAKVKEFPSFLFDKKNCLKMNELQRCTVTALETCEEQMMANLIDSIFNYIRKSTPCNKLTDPLTRCRRLRHLRRRRTPTVTQLEL